MAGRRARHAAALLVLALVASLLQRAPAAAAEAASDPTLGLQPLIPRTSGQDAGTAQLEQHIPRIIHQVLLTLRILAAAEGHA